MVPREEHLAVLANHAALQAERSADVQKVAELESEVRGAHDHRAKTIAEMEEMRAAQGGMVPRSELDEANGRCDRLISQLREAEHMHSTGMMRQKELEELLEAEKALLQSTLEVVGVFCRRLRCTILWTVALLLADQRTG